MTRAAAFSGDYTDLKFIKSRKVCVISVEIPIEQSAAFVAAFGTPNPSTGVPVALARLETGEDQKPAKERRRFSELPPSQQAAMRCNEPDFQRFLKDHCDVEQTPDSEMAAALVRAHCNVESRANLNTNPDAGAMWAGMEADFFKWQRGIR